MAREVERNVGGGAIEERRERLDDSQPTASGITASASGYANLGFIRTGTYSDMADDGSTISNPTDTVVWSDRPPGNSFNDDHYATDDGPGASYSDATSEVAAAVIRLEGQMEDAVESDFTWTRPDGVTAWDGSATIEAPDPGYYWTYVYFYTFIGRGFGQGGTAEIIMPGTYTVEFDTNYGTWSRSIELVGPEVVGCTIPSQVLSGQTTTAEATVTNTPDSSYSGTLVAAIPMTNNRTERGPLTLGTTLFSIAPGTTDVFDVPIDATEIGSPANTDVEIYCVTDSINAPVTDGQPFF